MIRRGNVQTLAAAGTSANVLEGTQFAQLSRAQFLTIRAKMARAIAATPADKYSLRLEDSTLSSGLLRGATLNAATAANVSNTDEGAGLTDDDIIFSGVVTPGSLILDFTLTAAGSIMWDVTSA